MRLPITLLILSLSTFGFSEDAPAVDLSKVPEVASVLKDMEKASTEARIKEIQKATRKLEPLVKKYAVKDIKVGAELQSAIEKLNKESAELTESLKDAPTAAPIKGKWKIVQGSWNTIITIADDGTFKTGDGSSGKIVVNGDEIKFVYAKNAAWWYSMKTPQGNTSTGDSWDKGKNSVTYSKVN